MTDPTPTVGTGASPLLPSLQDASGGLPVSRPASDRRARRQAVELDMLSGAHGSTWVGAIAARFGVTSRTIFTDRKHIERRWEREDARGMARRRSAVVRRLERIAATAEAAGDLRTAVSANATLARILGLDRPAASTTNVLAIGAGGGDPTTQVTTLVELVRLAALGDGARVVEAAPVPREPTSGGGGES